MPLLVLRDEGFIDLVEGQGASGIKRGVTVLSVCHVPGSDITRNLASLPRDKRDLLSPIQEVSTIDCGDDLP